MLQREKFNKFSIFLEIHAVVWIFNRTFAHATTKAEPQLLRMKPQKVVIAQDLEQSLEEAVKACEHDRMFILVDEIILLKKEHH